MRYLGASKFFTVDFFTWPYLPIVGGSFKRKYFTKDFYCSDTFPLFYRGTISIGLFAFELFSSSHFFPQERERFLEKCFFYFNLFNPFLPSFLSFFCNFRLVGELGDAGYRVRRLFLNSTGYFREPSLSYSSFETYFK